MRTPGQPRPLGYHLVLRLVDNRVIATTDAQRRVVARTVIEQAQEERLLAFGLVDTHLHAEEAEDWDRCGRFAQRVGSSLKQSLQLPVSFAPVHREPITSQSHLYRTFYYDLRQQDHHGVVTDPYHEASNLPDLLGLRVVGRPLNRHVRALLPRVTRQDLLELLGVPALSADTSVSCEHLLAAAAAAACLPALGDRQVLAVQARAAATHVALEAGLGCSAIGELLQLSSSRVRSLRNLTADPDLVRAIRLQLAWRQLEPARSNGI